MLKELLPANGFEEIRNEARDGSQPSSPAWERLASALKVLAAPPEDPEKAAASLLALALEVSRAERIFFFDAGPAVPPEPASLGRCLASLNIDLEPVREPEAKAPRALLEEVLAAGQPLLLCDLESGPPGTGAEPLRDLRVRAAGAVPLLVRSRPVGVVYFDHRFRPLEIDRSAARELLALCQALGLHHHFERVMGENRSLWQDVTRLKERTRASGEGTPAPPPRPQTHRNRLRGDYSLIVGSSAPMLEIFELLDRVSGSSAPVLINGESGTGKELIANAVHRNSPRHSRPFVSENCGALTETLLESELFGYVKGAFTGAAKDHKGLFELADSGSLFLDEVGDMSPSMQKKLLRVLQEGVIRRVGGKDYLHVDVRLICATNKDLLEECRQGRFREDLYYRLNVINIKVPSLRERKEDIPELVEHFLAEMARQSGQAKTIEPAALRKLCHHSWPGNIRELQNEVKRMYALSEDLIRLGDLSEAILSGEGRELLHGGLEKELAELTLREATERVEKELIRRALFAARGNKSLVAKKLEIPKTSLYNKINKYQLEKELP
jgi:transcriptional regulator with GAF, ATPase, and Fis domain